MGFNSNSASKAGKISKRGRSLPLELRNSLNDVANEILNNLDHKELTPTQQIKLLDVILKYTMPKVTIEDYEPLEMPKLEIAFSDGFSTDKVIKVNRDEFKNLK